MLSSTFNPEQLAINAINNSRSEISKSEIKNVVKNNDEVAETQKFLWVIDGKVNMAIPVDGWNALHWYRYFCMHFRDVFGHMYTGKNRTDMLCMGSFLFRAQRELGMSASEVKSCINWIAINRMPIMKAQGKIYFIAMLKEDLNDFYNAKVYALKHADERNKTKNRDIFIDNKDFRESIKKFISYDENNKIVDFDLRLLLQLGIPILLEYFIVQDCMDEKAAKDIILTKIEKIINEDLSRSSLGDKRSSKFEKIVKNSLSWEPYPWKDRKWRDMILKGIEFFKINNEKWWRPEPPVIKLKPATCLKILKSKKRG